ncbi:hypothetical protein CF161_26409 [Pseudomonas sp. CF161]|nr:hypothetical protein CF161_26409 [Pseudomonas sp. CF161]
MFSLFSPLKAFEIGQARALHRGTAVGGGQWPSAPGNQA